MKLMTNGWIPAKDILSVYCVKHGCSFNTCFKQETVYCFKHELVSFVITPTLKIQTLLVLLLLILLSGDVSENPGPDLDQSNQTNNLSILHLNIRSIRNKLEYVKDNFLDFDILCFTETHLNNNISNTDLCLEGFQPLSFRKDVSAHSSGLMIYVAEGLIAERIADLEVNLEESIWIEIKHKGESYLLCDIYRPPNTLVGFWQRFNITVERASEMSKKIIIVGDLNEDQLNQRNHNLKDITLFNNLINIINVPTRVTNTSQTLLDPIVLSETISVLDSGIMSVPTDISDHSATYVFITFSYNQYTAFKRVVWQYKKGDFGKFNRLISSTDWEYLKEDNFDNACENFTSRFINLAKECIPCKEVTIRPNDKPWYDSEIRTVSRKRDRLKNKAAKSGNTQDWQTYKRLRNKVNNLKKHAKEQFYNNIETTIIEAKNTNPRQYWKLIKHFMKSNKGAEVIPPLKTVSDSGAEVFSFTDLEKANTLNNYFESISNINEGNTELPNFVPKTANSLNSIHVEESEIRDIINVLEVNKACGHDLISHKMLKMTCDSVVKPLHILINRSLAECTFPTIWKKAIVMPLFKKGSSDTPSNYRPISLISTVGKLMERVVFKHLYNFFNSNNLIFKLQSGFLPGHSSVFQLIDIYNQICQSFDAKQYTCMVFCDISKAFDRVWHKGLLFKLKQNGIKGDLLKWISHYLSGRSQKVFVGSSMSESKILSAGVPQGSVLGPLLFLIYVNDIVEHLLSITRLFADDTSLSFTSGNIQDIEGILNHDLRIITVWAKQWLVDFNPNKTEAILFSISNVNNPNLYFDNVPVNFVDDHKHLGLTFSHDGKWHTHIETILSSAAKMLGVMRSLKFTLNRKTLNQLYFSYLRPLLEYASIVWDGCTVYEKQQLERFQYEAARTVTGLTRSVSIENLMSEIGWLSLSERRQFQKLVTMYKIFNGIAPEYLCNLLPPLVTERTVYNLRNAENISVMNRRTEIFAKSFIPSGSLLWNNLPLSIRSENTIDSFKLKLKELIYVSPQIPKYFIQGKRVESVFHCRIRNKCSNLNKDLYENHLKASQLCECGNGIEDAEHYFFRCVRYTNERITLFRATRKFHPLGVQFMLYGSDRFSEKDHIIFFSHIHQYIKDTKRFN